MLFPEQEVPEGFDPVSWQDLQPGAIYYRVVFVDERLTVPSVAPVVFLGFEEQARQPLARFRSAEAGLGTGGDGDSSGPAEFDMFQPRESLSTLFDFETMLGQVLASALRRRAGE
jgi:hypothetical protein